MQSTNFETTLNQSKEKIISIMDSHILSQPNQPNETKENQVVEDEYFEQINDDEEEDDIPIPIEDQEEDQNNSLIEFSDQSEPEQQMNDNTEQIDEGTIFEEDNIHMAIKQENLDEQFHDEEKKQYEVKHKNDKFQISLRSFQTTLIQNSRDKNSIIYLPTGTGKTRISICSMYYYLCKYGTSKKIVFLANTIQLVKQQAEAIKQTLSAIIQNQSFAKDLRQKLGSNYIQLNWKIQDLINQVICVHGQRSQDQAMTKRKRIQNFLTSRKQFINEMKKATVTVMISQMFLNCLRRGYIKITDYSFIVLDQCHHCVGDHPYMGIMKQFYYDKKKKNQKLQEQNRLQDKDRLPIIMGLTASPVSQPFNDYQKLTTQLKNLCINLDSNFAIYPYGDKITNQTEIVIQNIREDEERQLYPDLINFSERFKDHRSALQKIKIHFPVYYKCINEIINCMIKNHSQLRIEEDGSKITDPELYLFYDIKECLLMKLRDLWLQLGLFAFHLGFHQMVTELNRLSGLRNHQNTQLLNDLIDILKRYDKQFHQSFGKCDIKFMSKKLQKLIQILKPQSQEEIQSQKVRDMVLVFAFKRRTVKYLQTVLQKYRDLLSEKEKKFYKSIGITGYAGQKKVYRGQDGHSYQSNPSVQESQGTIARYYNNFVQTEKQKYSNKINQKSNLLQGQNKTLNNQMARMYFSKMGKVLLEVQQKYSNQIKKIIEFKKKEHRVLITTSVTQQGFDIPGCNLVISFDTPTSLKSYIQIKGRARKKNSKYIIFTFDKNYQKMMEDKNIYDNSINAIYELAINQISREKLNGLQSFKISSSYEKVMTYGGALLNTNYALQLLKSYFTSLKQPNRPYIHYIETSNICYRCIIKFPQSCTYKGSGFVVGKPYSKKEEALKSAAFQAVKLLKKDGLIRDDLRPSRLQQLEDELQLQKYDDLGMYSKDIGYKQIFDRYVQIQEYSQANSNNRKKLLKFYFKSLEQQKLQFPQLNKNFDNKTFQSGKEYALFQIYLIKFINVSKSILLTEQQGVNQIGMLTCFSQEQTSQIFAGFKQRLQPISQEYFQLRLITKEIKLTHKQYKELEEIHKFLLTSQKNNEIQYYNSLNNNPTVLNPNWNMQKNIRLKMDDTRKYYPLLVLLKKGKQTKNAYTIDEQTNIKIMSHIEIMKKIYMFHNKAAKYNHEKPFELSLKLQYEVVADTLKSTDIKNKKYLLQSISKDFCFHKGFLSKKIQKYDKNIQAQQKQKKNKLKMKFDRHKKYYQDWQKDIYHEQIMKIQLWKQSSKEDISEFLNKQLKLKKIDDEKGLHRFLKEFILFPITYPTMIRISLAVKYVFQVFQDYSTALYFRKYYLFEIFSALKNKIHTFQHYSYIFYNNIILQNFQKILNCLQNTGRSKYLRQFGKLIKPGFTRHILFNNINQSINNSKLINLDISEIDPQLNQSASNMNFSMNNMSHTHNSSIIQSFKNNQQPVHSKLNLKILESLRIDDILRSLTSKIYKHQKNQNYEEFQFIGDVVLKYLSTIQIFLDKPVAEEGEMHIARANLICNANLHRAAIKKRLFLYIFTTKKRKQPAPLKKIFKGVNPNNNQIQQLKYHNTDIPLLQFHDDCEGYQYIPGKVHADVMQALIGTFYLKNKNLNDCQTLLYAFGILNKPNLYIQFKPIQKEYQLPELYQQLQKRIGYRFKNKGLLIQSLTHPTFLRYVEDALDDQQSFYQLDEKNKSLIQNLSMMNSTIKIKQTKIFKHQTFYERLQFLGDSFLDLLVVEYLYDQGGDYLDDEGTLSFLKQSAVSNKTLGFIALKFNLQDLILMDLDDIDNTLKEFRQINKNINYLPSPVEFSKLKIGSLKILGDAFESLVGAILIDNQFNYQSTKVVLLKMIEPYIKHFTSMSFVQQCPSYKFKEYLNQNNYKKLKLNKILQEGIINGEYLYRFIDKNGNIAGKEIRASNDKDAWDKFFQFQDKAE